MESSADAARTCLVVDDDRTLLTLLGRLRPLAALAAVCGAALIWAPPASAVRACPSASAVPAKVAKRVAVHATLCVLNATRERHGIRPLRMNSRLSRAARRHARDMVRRNYFSHDSMGGASFVDRIRHAGYLDGAGAWAVAENIAWGSHHYSAPRRILHIWMNSPGHRANILNPRYRDIGIGLALGAPVAGSGGPATTYATDFGAR